MPDHALLMVVHEPVALGGCRRSSRGSRRGWIEGGAVGGGYSWSDGIAVAGRPVHPHFHLLLLWLLSGHDLHPCLRYARLVEARAVDPLLLSAAGRLLHDFAFAGHFPLNLGRSRGLLLHNFLHLLDSVRNFARLSGTSVVHGGSSESTRHGAPLVSRVEAWQVDGRVLSVGGVIDGTHIDDRVAGLLAAGWVGGARARRATRFPSGRRAEAHTDRFFARAA